MIERKYRVATSGRDLTNERVVMTSSCGKSIWYCVGSTKIVNPASSRLERTPALESLNREFSYSMLQGECWYRQFKKVNTLSKVEAETLPAESASIPNPLCCRNERWRIFFLSVALMF